MSGRHFQNAAMNEKTAFSQRLITTLKRAGISVLSPTKLANDFNLHYRGRPVTTQAAHRWLNGTAIPAQDKILTLAGWLNVSPEWLRYGDSGKKLLRQETAPYHLVDQQVINDFKRLSDEHKTVVREVIATLLRLEKR